MNNFHFYTLFFTKEKLILENLFIEFFKRNYIRTRLFFSSGYLLSSSLYIIYLKKTVEILENTFFKL